jgi:hypothetical protein
MVGLDREAVKQAFDGFLAGKTAELSSIFLLASLPYGVRSVKHIASNTLFRWHDLAVVGMALFVFKSTVL